MADLSHTNFLIRVYIAYSCPELSLYNVKDMEKCSIWGSGGLLLKRGPLPCQEHTTRKSELDKSTHFGQVLYIHIYIYIYIYIHSLPKRE